MNVFPTIRNWQNKRINAGKERHVTFGVLLQTKIEFLDEETFQQNPFLLGSRAGMSNSNETDLRIQQYNSARDIFVFLTDSLLKKCKAVLEYQC